MHYIKYKMLKENKNMDKWKKHDSKYTQRREWVKNLGNMRQELPLLNRKIQQKHVQIINSIYNQTKKIKKKNKIKVLTLIQSETMKIGCKT